MAEKVLMAWSGGKDSALALHEVLRAGSLNVTALLTTITAGYDRISMHGVRVALLDAQAQRIGLPVEKVVIPQQCTGEQYDELMRTTLARLKASGIAGVVFGDLFLADIRRYREEKMAQVDMTAYFPLWGRKTADLARAFISLGFRAIITCVDTRALDGRFAGRDFDEQFLKELPQGIDPCGENGEFHTFVWDGPIFRRPIECTRGEIVLRDERFNFCDLLHA
jgi:uncharacterized protein (TIGR00290 family)